MKWIAGWPARLDEKMVMEWGEAQLKDRERSEQKGERTFVELRRPVREQWDACV